MNEILPTTFYAVEKTNASIRSYSCIFKLFSNFAGNESKNLKHIMWLNHARRTTASSTRCYPIFHVLRLGVNSPCVIPARKKKTTRENPGTAKKKLQEEKPRNSNRIKSNVNLQWRESWFLARHPIDVQVKRKKVGKKEERNWGGDEVKDNLGTCTIIMLITVILKVQHLTRRSNIWGLKLLSLAIPRIPISFLWVGRVHSVESSSAVLPLWFNHGTVPHMNGLHPTDFTT